MPCSMQQRDAQGGYVLVALLASSAIMLAALALAIPRMAVQAQRVKEETLVYRGKQYRRAIELYFREHRKYPEDLDDLEDTDGVRYLRKRYKDPLTGEDQWRMIHMGADGRFKDSLLYDLAEESEENGQDDGWGSSFGGSDSQQSFGAGGPAHLADPRGGSFAGPGGAAPSVPPPLPGQFQGGSRAQTVRQSAAPDPTQQMRYGQGFEFPMGAQQSGPGQQPRPGDGPDGPSIRQQPDYRATTLPSQMPMDENRPPPPNPNAPFGQQRQPGRPGFDPTRSLQGLGGGLPFRAGGIQPAALPGGRTPAGRQAYGPGTAPGRTQAGSARPPVAGGNPAAFAQQGVGVSATSIIQRLLTTPRPGGLAGLQGYQQVQAAGGGGAAAFQEGIAGVASLVEDIGVKTYAGRELYNEWEFVYDYRKDQGSGMDPAAGAPADRRPQGVEARGLGSNAGMGVGISPRGRQTSPGPRSPALGGNYPGGLGAGIVRTPGTASRPGYSYGRQPSAGGPYRPAADGDPYRPTGTPSPYGDPSGAPFLYETPPDIDDPNPANRPDGPFPLNRPPAPEADPRRR